MCVESSIQKAGAAQSFWKRCVAKVYEAIISAACDGLGAHVTGGDHNGLVLKFFLAFLAALRVFFRSRTDTALEILALWQQVAVLKRKRPRPRWNGWDRWFWTSLRQLWPRWTDVLALVKPETVVGWHRAGFRSYWRSRTQRGRPQIREEVRALIRRMAVGSRTGAELP